MLVSTIYITKYLSFRFWVSMVNKQIFDMASTAKSMPKFTGENEEDVTVWIRDCTPISSIVELNT